MEAIISLIPLLLVLVMIVAWWKVFEKAGQPGWAAFVPIYNIFVFLEIVGRPAWWIILMFIPLVNAIVLFVIAMDMAECFGQSRAWGFFMLGLFGFIGYPLLAFGDAQYSGPHA